MHGCHEELCSLISKCVRDSKYIYFALLITHTALGFMTKPLAQLPYTKLSSQ